MNFKISLHLIYCLPILLLSCGEKADVKERTTTELIREVKGQVNAFQKADTTLSSEGVLDLLWPEFTMLADGNRITYKKVKESSRDFMLSLESFNTEWDSLRIIPLGNDYAISSFFFTDSIVAKDGTITQSKGPNTFVWERREGKWKVLYADADHYPIE
ncbi:nuclear transport factor 2 family protein [Ulvibacterium sp.]|uniref:nuclear transport factor 2 family protein n=1 Tax=Ulvibacterium sp. TaxID=2665914 RepID=UPI00260D7F36|nr:nuclear transport factor 2 family protein [Ulvibacterium sp.]